MFGDPVPLHAHPGPGHVHAFGGRVPAHAGVGHRGRHRDAAARHHDAAADAGRLGPGDGMALSRGARPASSPSFAGHRVAGLPFFAPETVTTDHGGPYKSRTAVAAQQALGCNILPARVLRPQDKAACERAFGSLRSLLFEHLPGYTGIDVADRGADPEADAVADHGADGTSGRGMDYFGLAEPGSRGARPGLGPGRGAQPEHAVRRRDEPGRVLPAGPPAGTVLRAPARPSREDPRRPRGEDRRALVRPGRPGAEAV